MTQNGVDIVKFVDISREREQLGLPFDKAVVFLEALPKDRINKETFKKAEKRIEKLADQLSCFIREKGYHARAQSEHCNYEYGMIEEGFYKESLKLGISILPQKTLACMSGVGFMGKNNLLIHEVYGCALSICSVLTDAPLYTEKYELLPSKCGKCEICVKSCESHALKNRNWSKEGGREWLLNISKCTTCLKCMQNCPWTVQYRKG